MKIEPTPEDYAKVRDDVAHARERMLELLARREAVARARRERSERRRRLLRRLLPFRRAA